MSTEVLSRAALTDILGASLTEEQARAIFRHGEETVIFALLTLAGKLAALQPATPSPMTPSGMIPAYQKPPAPRRRKRPGRKAGHPGVRRPTPERIDQRQEHRLPVARTAGDGCGDAPIRALAISRTSRGGFCRS